MLALDEATANVDRTTDALIQVRDRSAGVQIHEQGSVFMALGVTGTCGRHVRGSHQLWYC